MTFKRLAVALAALLALAPLMLVAADTAAPQLMVQTKTITLDPIADQTRGAMKWSHGAFLYVAFGPGDLPFYTLDREGRLLSSATAVIPGSAHVSLGDFDRRDDSSIVFIGQAYSAYGEPAPFIALISTDGRTERVIRTAPYWPYMLSVAPDGTFWTLGYEMVNFDPSALGVNPDAGVLRHFDRAGKLLRSALPQSQFVKDYTTRFQLVSGSIAATRNRIGWYGPRSGRGGQYVEIDSTSMTMHTYPALPDLPEGDEVMDFNLTESGNALLSLYSLASNRWTVLTFDRAALKWLPIKGPAPTESPGSHPIGVDGEQLVYQSWKSAIFFSLSH